MEPHQIRRQLNLTLCQERMKAQKAEIGYHGWQNETLHNRVEYKMSRVTSQFAPNTKTSTLKEPFVCIFFSVKLGISSTVVVWASLQTVIDHSGVFGHQFVNLVELLLGGNWSIWNHLHAFHYKQMKKKNEQMLHTTLNNSKLALFMVRRLYNPRRNMGSCAGHACYLLMVLAVGGRVVGVMTDQSATTDMGETELLVEWFPGNVLVLVREPIIA